MDMSNRTQRRWQTQRKAMRSVKAAECFAPDKIRYDRLRDAQRAARRQPGLRPYVCGGHYHLTSKAIRRAG